MLFSVAGVNRLPLHLKSETAHRTVYSVVTFIKKNIEPVYGDYPLYAYFLINVDTHDDLRNIAFSHISSIQYYFEQNKYKAEKAKFIVATAEKSVSKSTICPAFDIYIFPP